MSDRAATETKLTSLLIEAKTRELESKLTNWHSLTNVERERMTRVYAFTCGAHKVHNTSEAMNKAAIDHLYTSDELSSRGLIGAKKHIYEADKLLCTEVRKEYSEGKDFRAYCLTEEKVAESACGLFRPIVGSRYLVYFHCSIPTFIGQEFIQTFLVNQREAKGSWNRLEKAVYDGYFDDRILAEERTYGILYTEVLLPLLTKCKVASDPLAMNECYTTAVTKLRQWSEEPELIFNENDHIWPDVTLHYPEYMQKIREKHQTDDLVIELLKVCCKAGAQKLKDHATEHLPGGLYGDPSLEQHKAASLIPTATNDTCESDFGMLSQQHKFAPSSNPLSLGAIVMAKRDHSAEWAMKQDKEDRKKVVSAARMEAIRAMKKYGTRDKQLSTIFRQKEARKQVQRERRRAALLKKSQKKSQMKDALQDGQFN
ncbi:uncharacterized protein [Ptychodera flava]|uniref:uncharacterized protein n=1 Tax=Ptychodera flava TaxID=63121 RepID=UPI00396A6D9D